MWIEINVLLKTFVENCFLVYWLSFFKQTSFWNGWSLAHKHICKVHIIERLYGLVVKTSNFQRIKLLKSGF